MACTVSNRRGKLRFRPYWNNAEWTEGTELTDTPKNRELVEARAVLISREMECKTFDYLRWFPNGNRAHQYMPSATKPQTVGDYY
jgi:hypothetical protein